MSVRDFNKIAYGVLTNVYRERLLFLHSVMSVRDFNKIAYGVLTNVYASQMQAR